MRKSKLLIQPYIGELKSYQAGLSVDELAVKYGLKPAEIIQLSLNENAFGMSPKSRKALVNSASTAHRYTDAVALQKALAKHLGLTPNNIIVGSGSNEILDLAGRVFLCPGHQAVLSLHAFSIYALVGQSVGAENVIVPAQNYSHDLKAMAGAITPKSRVLWIANPNNPTGTFVEYEQVKQFIASLPESILVVLDEAYYEYLEPQDRVDTTKWLAEFPNLLITRTFSKAYGLAGLRIGYGLGNPEVIELLNRVRQPFNVSSSALAAALAALADQAYVQTSNQRNLNNRELLEAGLTKLKLEQLPSRANFVTFKVVNATEITNRLLERGVVVRWLGGDNMPDHIRVTVGTAEEINIFLRNLGELLPGVNIPSRIDTDG